MEADLLEELTRYNELWFRERNLLQDGKTINLSITIVDPKKLVIDFPLTGKTYLRAALELLPKGVSTRVTNCVYYWESEHAGMSLNDKYFQNEPLHELLKIRNFGKNTLRLLGEALAKKGLHCRFMKEFTL